MSDSVSQGEIEASIAKLGQAYQSIREQMAKVIVGQDDVIGEGEVVEAHRLALDGDARHAIDGRQRAGIGQVEADLHYMTLRTMCRRFDVKGRTSLGQRPFSPASAHSLLSSTAGLSIS